MRGYEARQQPIPPESIEHLLQYVENDLKKNVHVSHPLLPFLRMAGMGMVAGGIAVLSLAGSLSLWQGRAPTVVSSMDAEPVLANAFAEVANQEVTLNDAAVPQPQVAMHEKINPSLLVVPNPPSPQDPQPARVTVAPPPTKKPKSPSPAKVENTTKVAKVKGATPPQRRTVAKRSPPSQKKLPQLRVVQPSQAKTLGQSANHDRLFDE